jgi:hypothetical protein
MYTKEPTSRFERVFFFATPYIEYHHRRISQFLCQIQKYSEHSKIIFYFSLTDVGSAINNFCHFVLVSSHGGFLN